jgi:hypothetical protein
MNISITKKETLLVSGTGVVQSPPKKFGYSIVKLLDPRLVKYRLSPGKAGPRVNGSLWGWHLQILPRSHLHPTLTLLICSSNPH